MFKEILPTGERNAVPAAVLADRLGIGERKLREMITEERRAGVVICSSPAGYYLPANKTETARFLEAMEKRAKHTFTAIQSARRELGLAEGQLAFDFEDTEEQESQTAEQ